jgi:hypothetical protein
MLENKPKGNRMNPWLAPLLFATSLLAQPAEVRLPDESTGIDGITRTLVSVFDQADIIALGETHQSRLDTDLRIAVVRHPRLREESAIHRSGVRQHHGAADP